MLCDAVSELQYATDCSLGGIGQGRTLPKRAERGRKGLSGRRCDFSPWCIIGTEHSQYISCGREYQDIDITSKLTPQYIVLYNLDYCFLKTPAWLVSIIATTFQHVATRSTR